MKAQGSHIWSQAGGKKEMALTRVGVKNKQHFESDKHLRKNPTSARKEEGRGDRLKIQQEEIN